MTPPLRETASRPTPRPAVRSRIRFPARLPRPRTAGAWFLATALALALLPWSSPARAQQPPPPERIAFDAALRTLQTGFGAQAADQFAEFAARNPDSPLAAEAILIECRARADLGRLDAAAQRLTEQLERLGPLRDQGLHALGEIHLRRGDPQAAATAFDRLIRESPQSPLLLQAGLGQALALPAPATTRRQPGSSPSPPTPFRGPPPTSPTPRPRCAEACSWPKASSLRRRVERLWHPEPPDQPAAHRIRPGNGSSWKHPSSSPIDRPTPPWPPPPTCSPWPPPPPPGIFSPAHPCRPWRRPFPRRPTGGSVRRLDQQPCRRHPSPVAARRPAGPRGPFPAGIPDRARRQPAPTPRRRRLRRRRRERRPPGRRGPPPPTVLRAGSDRHHSRRPPTPWPRPGS